MHCSEYLKLFSDVRDGLIADPALRRRFERHGETCRQCGLYGDTVDRGLALLRADAVEPSLRFKVRLRSRLARLERRRRVAFPWPARVVASLLVLTAVVEGVVQTSRQLETPAPAPSPALPKVTANPGYPFVTVSQLSVPVFETEIGAPALDPLEYVGTYRPPDASAHSVRTAIEP